MQRLALSFAAGLLFGAGLTVSQMINPAKVLGFLDLFGDWDPSLAFVMLGAIPIAAIGYRKPRRRAPSGSPQSPMPTRIDARLVAGALIFGIGWGLVGYCPGPALASTGLGNSETILFLASMLAGMAAFGGFQVLTGRRNARRPSAHQVAGM